MRKDIRPPVLVGGTPRQVISVRRKCLIQYGTSIRLATESEIGLSRRGASRRLDSRTLQPDGEYHEAADHPGLPAARGDERSSGDGALPHSRGDGDSK